MLRSANDALLAHKAAAATAVTGLAAALLIPAAMVLAGILGADAARQYLAAYRPVVYLRADLGAPQANRLADELGARPSVDAAEVRTPSDAFGDLQTRVGRREVAKMGVRPEMLPFSVLVRPATPVVGHLAVVDMVSQLETRAEVGAVDVPSSEAVQNLVSMRWLIWFGGAILVLVLIGGVAQTRACLISLADSYGRETELLALFGAPPSVRRRPTLIRGATVGLLAGALASVGLAAVFGLWQQAPSALVAAAGHAGGSGWPWVVVAAPLVLGPASGVVAGWLANQSYAFDENHDDMDIQTLVAPR